MKEPIQIRGRRPMTRKKRETGKTRRVTFVPQEGGAEFIAIDADTQYRLTISAPVTVTVDDSACGYVSLDTR